MGFKELRGIEAFPDLRSPLCVMELVIVMPPIAPNLTVSKPNSFLYQNRTIRLRILK